MKAAHWIACAGVALLVLRHRRRAERVRRGARVGELAEEPIFDGTNWTGTAYDRMWHASDLKDPTARNASGDAQADPSKISMSGFAAGWDGSL